jgi:iron(III) transport system permease protein
MSSLTDLRKWGIAEVVLTISILILVVVVAIPVLLIFWTSFVVNGSLNVKDVMDILGQRDTYEALKNSLIIA